MQLRLSKPIRKPNPPEEIDWIQYDTDQPDYSGSLRQVFSTRNWLWWVSFGFPPPKLEKPESFDKNPDFDEKFLDFDEKTQILVKIFQISVKQPRFQQYFQ